MLDVCSVWWLSAVHTAARRLPSWLQTNSDKRVQVLTFMHGIYEANISKILVVATLR